MWCRKRKIQDTRTFNAILLRLPQLVTLVLPVVRPFNDTFARTCAWKLILEVAQCCSPHIVLIRACRFRVYRGAIEIKNRHALDLATKDCRSDSRHVFALATLSSSVAPFKDNSQQFNNITLSPHHLQLIALLYCNRNLI